MSGELQGVIVGGVLALVAYIVGAMLASRRLR